MEQHRLNIDNVTEIKTLFHAGWLFADHKRDEIILETNSLGMNPVRLKATLITLCEGILNSSTKLSTEPTHEINYNEINVPDLKTLALELTRLTGINFSVASVS